MCQGQDRQETVEYAWLEDIRGRASCEWVESRNRETLDRLTTDPRFEWARALVASCPPPMQRSGIPMLIDGRVHEVVVDQNHPSGAWSRMSLDTVQTGATGEILLDLGDLPRHDGRECTWNQFGISDPVVCPEDTSRCVMRLNIEGGDDCILREFDIERGVFVEDGFSLDIPSSLEVAWLDRDTLCIAAALGPKERTVAGWSRLVRRWKRGTPIESAPVVFDAGAPMLVRLSQMRLGDRAFAVATVIRTFVETEIWVLDDGETPRRLPLPPGVGWGGLAGETGGRVIFSTNSAGEAVGVKLPAGALASLDLARWLEGETNNLVHILFEHSENRVLSLQMGQFSGAVTCTPSRTLFVILDNVRPRLIQATSTSDGWDVTDVPLPEWHSVQLGTAHREEVLAQIESFTSPPTLNLVEAPGTLRQLRASAALTDLSGYVTSQHWAHNADGTRVPYLHVSRGAAGKDGPQSLMLYAYGGFGLTNTPKYFSAFIGCDALLPWLGAGGDFVIAFPRGGGELGPGWHSAAVGEHRQRSFDDVYAVANDLIERRVTSNERLAVAGLSNGGLMASVALTQRPELFRAVLVGVPLTDMLRYHLLLSGPAWMPEYGDPNDPKMRQTLLAYSPLHNVFEARRYPEALFYATSTDDRVHPGHARRMVAKLRATGNPVLYFEPDAGGHAGSASPKQSATMAAVQATYLFQKTGLWPKDVRSLSGEIVPSSTTR